MHQNQRFIFVIGGIFSGIGKGLIAASTGKLFRENGNTVIIQKNDTYLNIDPGFLNPSEHGEVFVTHDGLETDLDLGHYERFLDQNLTRTSLITGGQIYASLLTRERQGEFHGKTIDFYQVVAEIKARYEQLAAKNPTKEIFIIELGGTVDNDDITAFLTAAKQMQRQYGANRVVFLYLTYLTYLTHVEEFKTKAAQHSIRQLREHAIEPDFVFPRCDRPVPAKVLKKFEANTFLDSQQVIPVPNQNIYFLPHHLKQSGFFENLLKVLALPNRQNPESWQAVYKNLTLPKPQIIKLAIVNKYPNFRQAYLSLFHSLYLAFLQHKIEFVYDEINPSELTKANVVARLANYDGIVVPGGFGTRGVEGKILALEYARTHKKPLLAICLGYQLVLIEIARNVLGISTANSLEFAPNSADPLIEYVRPATKTMLIGAQAINLSPGTLAARIWQTARFQERFRNRFIYLGVKHRAAFEAQGVIFNAHLDNQIPVGLELKHHPFFFATQFHPEWTTTILHPNPLFFTFINHCLNSKQQKNFAN